MGVYFKNDKVILVTMSLADVESEYVTVPIDTYRVITLQLFFQKTIP